MVDMQRGFIFQVQDQRRIKVIQTILCPASRLSTPRAQKESAAKTDRPITDDNRIQIDWLMQENYLFRRMAFICTKDESLRFCGL